MENEENKASHLKPRRRKKRKTTKKKKRRKRASQYVLGGKNAEIARKGNAKEKMEKRRKKGMSNGGLLEKL